MKVCLITSLYSPYRRGGAEVIAKEEIKRFQNRGDDVFVITIKSWQNFRSVFFRLENIEGVRVYRFFPLNLFSFIKINKMPRLLRLPWHFFDLFNLHSYFVIKKILKKEKPDLVLTHNLKGIGYLTWRAIKSLTIKNIHTLHDVQLAAPSGLMIYGRKKNHPIYSRLCRWLINSPAEIISPSQWLMDFYTQKGFFKNSQQTINLAFGKLPPVKQLNLKPSEETIKFLYVGQMEKSKGILWLVEILEKLPTTNPLRQSFSEASYQLLIIGDGSQLERVKEIVGKDERFKIYGRLENRERDEIISQSNFVVVPSLAYENSPTIISQSLALEIPVIAAKIGGIGELVKAGVNGYLFEPGNEESLKEILLSILE